MLIEKLRKEIEVAVRNKDETRKSCLRVLLGDCQMHESKSNKPLVDSAVRKIAGAICNGIKESIKISKEHGRDVEKLEKELEILSEYEPKILSFESLQENVMNDQKIIDSVKSAKSEGQAVGAIMKNFESGTVNPEDVKKLIKEIKN